VPKQQIVDNIFASLPKRSQRGNKYALEVEQDLLYDAVAGPDNKTEAKKKAIFDDLDQQYRRLMQAQATDIARQEEQRRAMLQQQQAQAINNAANQRSPEIDFLTSGDVGYFDQPKFNIFSPFGMLKEESVSEKSKLCKVDPKIHRRKFNFDA